MSNRWVPFQSSIKSHNCDGDDDDRDDLKTGFPVAARSTHVVTLGELIGDCCPPSYYDVMSYNINLCMYLIF